MNFILIIAISFFCSTLSYGQKTPFYTKWQTAKFDKPEELSNMDFLYDSDGRLLYLLTNDKDNLYVHVRAIDDITQKKIIELGFSVELIIKGDKIKRLIEFPLPRKERMEPVILLANTSEKKRKDFNLVKEQMVEQIYVMRTSGFNNSLESVKASENKFNLLGKLEINKNGQLQYLLTIPLSAIGVNVLEEHAINFVLKSGSMEAVSSQGPPQGGGGGRQGGGGHSGGHGGGGGRQGGSPQGGSGGQERGGAESAEKQAERAEMSKAINVKLKNVMLLKEGTQF